MITMFTCTQQCLQESQHKVPAFNRTVPLLHVQFLDDWNQALPDDFERGGKEAATSFKQLLRFSQMVGRTFAQEIEREFSNFKHFRKPHQSLHRSYWISCSHVIILIDSATIIPFSPLSFASHTKYFASPINAIDLIIIAFCSQCLLVGRLIIHISYQKM